MKVTTDKARLLRHFQKDPVLFSYLIGDLDDFFFPLCTWPILETESGDIDEVILFFNNPRFVCVQALGLTNRFPELLEQSISIFPERFYCHYLPAYQDIFERHFDEQPLSMHSKMRLDTYAICHDDADQSIRRLDMSHLDAALRLYDAAYPERYFDERLLATGKFFGYFDRDKLVSIAGVHVYSSQYKIAVLGSIATYPDYRGKGLATKVTSRLIKELLNSVAMVTLNVQGDNLPAIRCYERLGFVRHCEYKEALFTRRKRTSH